MLIAAPTQIVTDLILVIAGVLGLAAATIHDLRTREVPDWITYGLIAVGLSIRLIGSLSAGQWSYVLYGIFGFIVMYALANLMYYAKQWGGGDAKMLMALGVVFATKPYFLQESSIPFLGTLLINILIIGAAYGFLWGIWLSGKHWKKFTKEAKILLREKKMAVTRIYALILALFIFIIAFLIEDLFIKITIMTFSMIILLYPYLWVYVKAVEKACLYRTITPQQLTEGDWVEEDILVKEKIIYKRKNTGIEKADIQKLMRANVKKILVKDGIPFIPPFFLGTLATLLQWSIFSFI